jgi:predicted TIM-barrel fold metal-dependent hydrolase
MNQRKRLVENEPMKNLNHKASVIYSSALLVLVVLMIWLGAGGCSFEKDGDDFLGMKKIDFHSHYRYPRVSLIHFFKQYEIQAILIDVTTSDSSGIQRRWDPQKAHRDLYPEHFYLCTSFSGDGIDEDSYAHKVIEQIAEDVRNGAMMVKVWKNFGMVTQDSTGAFVQIDDARLRPIWEYLTEQGIPVIAHIGEPIQAWRPLDDPTNPHYGYYQDHPQYHAFNHPEIPSWESIMRARDRWISANPDLTIIGAHLGSMSHDVTLVAERLDAYPNFYVETAARFGDLARQPSEKVKSFFTEYQDRILFGTDYGNTTPEAEMDPADLTAEVERIQDNYRLLWDYVATKDSVIIRGQHTEGLGLEKSTLEKFFYANALKILGL